MMQQQQQQGQFGGAPNGIDGGDVVAEPFS